MKLMVLTNRKNIGLSGDVFRNFSIKAAAEEKNLKLGILVVFIFIITIQVFGQERVNRKKLCFDEISDTLTKATGWAYNENFGEWIDYENVISDDKRYKNYSLQGEYMMSKSKQSFLKIQTKSLNFKGTKYYVMILDKWSGFYRYSYIEEDWCTFKEINGYIFTDSEYQKLRCIENFAELRTQKMVSINSRLEKCDELKLLDLIQTKLEQKESEYSTFYIFPIMKSTEGKIRFYIPENSYTSLKYDFKKKYFETDIKNFSKIII